MHGSVGSCFLSRNDLNTGRDSAGPTPVLRDESDARQTTISDRRRQMSSACDRVCVAMATRCLVFVGLLDGLQQQVGLPGPRRRLDDGQTFLVADVLDELRRLSPRPAPRICLLMCGRVLMRLLSRCAQVLGHVLGQLSPRGHWAPRG